MYKVSTSVLESLLIFTFSFDRYHGTRNKKRPQLHPDQDRTAPFPIKKRSHQELLTATTDLRFGQNYDSESSRPFKHPRIENPVVRLFHRHCLFNCLIICST